MKKADGDDRPDGWSRINWSAVELDYRSGALSLREMALKHGCSHSAIANFAGRQGWTRSAARRPGNASAARF